MMFPNSFTYYHFLIGLLIFFPQRLKLARCWIPKREPCARNGHTCSRVFLWISFSSSVDIHGVVSQHLLPLFSWKLCSHLLLSLWPPQRCHFYLASLVPWISPWVSTCLQAQPRKSSSRGILDWDVSVPFLWWKFWNMNLVSFGLSSVRREEKEDVQTGGSLAPVFPQVSLTSRFGYRILPCMP